MASSLFGQQNNPQSSQPQQNNSIQTMISAMQAGKRPQDVLPELAKKDPTVMRAMQIINGNPAQAVTGMIQQMAGKAGISIPQLIQRLGIK